MIQNLDLESQVLDAVDRLLASGEYHRMSFDVIAREAGVDPNVLYLHFQTKVDILLAHADRIVRRIVAVEKQIAAEGEPAPDRVRQILMFRVLAYFDSVQHFSDSLDDLFRDLRSELCERRCFYLEWEAEVIEPVLREFRGTRTSLIRDAPGTARALLAATDALLPMNCISSELHTRARVARKAAVVTDLVLEGLLETAKRPRSYPRIKACEGAASRWTRKLL